MDATIVEKRAAPRHRVFKHGMLAFHGGGGMDCTVRNVSTSGARIEVANPVGLPDDFTLVITGDQFMRRCRSVWSNANHVGVAFDQSD